MRLPFPRTLLVIAIMLASTVAYACQVPVFRYALERWNADRYRVVILSDGPLSEDAKTTLKPLQKASQSGPKSQARIELNVLDINQTDDPRLKKVWEQRVDKTRAVLATYYPLGSDAPADTPASVSAFDEAGVEQLLVSPARKEVEKHLLSGCSAVWIFVETGDTKRDQEAYETLSKQLEADESWLKLPTPEELEVGEDVLTSAKIKLQIKFAIVRVKIQDPAEQFLIDTLLNSESDLRSFDEPMAFPVFGRGRVLYALIGKGIAPDIIRTASSFMVGPCSCQVKNQNPGFDLLMMTDWDKAVGDTLISEPIEELPDDLEPTLLTIPPGRDTR